MERKFRAGPRGAAGVGVFFISNGAVFAGLLPWYPLMFQRLDLDSWEFGLCVASFAIGAIASSVLPSRLIARFRAVPVMVSGTILLAGVIALAGWAGNVFALTVCIFLIGFFDAIVDVAQNVVGIAIQDTSGRSILSSMHALWSLGGVISGAASTAAAAAEVDLRVYLAFVGIACILLAVLGGFLVGDGVIRPKPTPDHRVRSVLGRPKRRFVLAAAFPLTIIAICGTTVEDIANNWAAIAAVQISEVPASSAGIAFSVVIGSQCLGRFSGDLLIRKRGQVWVARWGGSFIVLGGLAIITAQEILQLLAGFAAVGHGAATLVPSALAAAARLPGMSQAAGVTLVNWTMRVGFLATSPLIGLITTTTNLRWGLSLLLIVGAASFLFAGRLAPPGQAAETRPPAQPDLEDQNAPLLRY